MQEASRHSPRPSPPHAWEPLSKRGGLASPVWHALPPWARHPTGCDGSQLTRPCWCPGWGGVPCAGGCQASARQGSCPEEPSGAVCRGPPSVHSAGGSDGATPDAVVPTQTCALAHAFPPLLLRPLVFIHVLGALGAAKNKPLWSVLLESPPPAWESHNHRVLGEGWPERSLGRWGWQGRGHRRTGHDRAGSLAPPWVYCCPPHGQTGGSGIGSRAPPRVAGPSPCWLPGAGPQRPAAHCVPGVRVVQGTGGVRGEPQLLRVPGGPL